MNDTNSLENEEPDTGQTVLPDSLDTGNFELFAHRFAKEGEARALAYG